MFSIDPLHAWRFPVIVDVDAIKEIREIDININTRIAASFLDISSAILNDVISSQKYNKKHGG